MDRSSTRPSLSARDSPTGACRRARAFERVLSLGFRPKNPIYDQKFILISGQDLARRHKITSSTAKYRDSGIFLLSQALVVQFESVNLESVF
jgi:hypothetical protein